MPRLVKEMPALAVKRLKEPKLHAVGGVPGLHLQISSRKAKSWILRTVVGSKRRDIGLGAYPTVSLTKARDKARELKDQIREGQDPVLVRREIRASLVAKQASTISFAEAARRFLDVKGDEWRSAKHRAQWKSTLDAHAKLLASMRVSDIRTEHVLQVLEPIWKELTETAARVRQRIETILDWAAVRGYRSGENPARWKGNFEHLLPKPGKIAKARHYKAIPLSQMGRFMHELRQREGISARALEFVVLTAVRSGEARGARWAEIDLSDAIWTVPGGRTKAGREHRVPLSKPAIELLESIRPANAKQGDWVFAAMHGKSLSAMSLTAVMRRMKVDAVPHGLRSTFRDWAAERTSYPCEIAEMALARAIANKAQSAYHRGDLLAKRRRMMEEWATFCGGIEIKQGNVASRP